MKWVDEFYDSEKGKVVIVMSPEDANKVVKVISGHPLGSVAKIIGEVLFTS